MPDFSPDEIFQEAMQELWNDAPGPEEMWGIRIVLAMEGDDSTVRHMYAPLMFPEKEVALALSMAMHYYGTEYLQRWVRMGWAFLPDTDHEWLPLAAQVVKLARVPF